MSLPTSRKLAEHVEAARRLLSELDQHADVALQALSEESGSEFLAAVEERDRILAQLDDVVDALAQQRSEEAEQGVEADPATTAMFAEMAQAAAAALESHNRLTLTTQLERDRIASAVQRNGRPDSVANQYAAVANGPRSGTLSVTG
jgi:hypothetical protein